MIVLEKFQANPKIRIYRNYKIFITNYCTFNKNVAYSINNYASGFRNSILCLSFTSVSTLNEEKSFNVLIKSVAHDCYFINITL